MNPSQRSGSAGAALAGLGKALVVAANFALAVVVIVATPEWLRAVHLQSVYYAAVYYAILFYTAAPVLALMIVPCVLLWRRSRTRVLSVASLSGGAAVFLLTIQSIVLSTMTLRL